MDPYKKQSIKQRVKKNQKKHDSIPFKNKDVNEITRRIDSLRAEKKKKMIKNQIVKDVEKIKEGELKGKMINKPAKNK